MVWRGARPSSVPPVTRKRIRKNLWRKNPVEELLADTVCDTCSLGQESLTEKTRVAYSCSSILVKEEGTTQSETALSGDAVEAFECILGEQKFEDTRDEASQGLVEQVSSLRASTSSTKACQCGRHVPHIPQLDPSKWPQAPLLLRPKPDGGTKVLGIRKEANNTDFLWKPGQDEQWWDVLRNEWDPSYSPSEDDVAHAHNFCEHCVILPINNGTEKPGETLVVDFESPLFEGTLMLRVKGTNGTTTPRNGDDDDGSYFSGKVVRYQTVLRGRFKKELPFFSLVTGNRFRRPCGKLPPNFVMWATIKVIHFFAPQLSMRLEKCNRPYVLSPFGSAPRTIIVEDSSIEPGNSNGVMTRDLSEPKEASQSILARDNPIQNSLERARARKKQMDQFFISQSATPTTDPDKLYTFEFLQHLFDYQKFQIDVSQSMHAKLKDLLNGQPLQIMAASSLEAEQEWSIDNEIFAFEIWNECLLQDAQAHLEI